MRQNDASTTCPFTAVIFDMDGVVTRTADVHARAWKDLFDDFLQRHKQLDPATRRPFDAGFDYRTFVDGKPRHAGVRGFLQSRGIDVPEGQASDPPTADTVHGLAKRKDALFEQELHRQGVKTFDSTVTFIKTLRQAGIKTALVTSSRHGRDILATARLTPLFDSCLDGVDIHELGLAGKPDPSVFLECARRLDVKPSHALVVEDAVAGVSAGQAGGFALTIGVDRGGNAEALSRYGADLVIADLAELSLPDLAARVETQQRESAWFIEQTGFDPAREPDLESIFTVANGYAGARGSPDIPLPNSQGDLFIAGIYACKLESRPYSEHEFLTEERPSPYTELVSLPFPFRLAVSANGEALGLGDSLSPAHKRWRSNRRVLDLKNGMLRHETTFVGAGGHETSLRTRRCASLADRHLLLQEISLCPENHSAGYRLDASLVDSELKERHPHLIPSPVEVVDGTEIQCYRTHGSNFRVCLASRTLFAGEGDGDGDREGEGGGGEAKLNWRGTVRIGEALNARRFVAVYTSRDCDDPVAAAVQALRARSWDGFDRAMAEHRRAWETVWRQADIDITGAPAESQALRFQIYHLISAADHDPGVSVGARALTGRAYEGHVFWDVEIFMLPFYLHTRPALARGLLQYRHRTLDGARQRATQLGYRGACYAWESTTTGEDVTPHTIVLRTTQKEIPIYTGTQQVHVTADVAYGLWRYWQATGDDGFMAGAGVEILAETARFWCSRCTPGDACYHIRTVVGPDEYHHSVNDNAYTNWMAWFNLGLACRALPWLKQHDRQRWESLCGKIGLDEAETAQWQAVAEKLYRPRPGRDGVIEQFEGFFDLDDYELPRKERFKAPVSRLFDWREINRLKLIKQADVLMLLHLFSDWFPPDVVAANYAYYEPLTDHGSSLSPSIHAAIAARLGRREEAERYWRQSLFLDLSNVMHNSSLGVHPAAMGGTWQALVWGFLGVSLGGPPAGEGSVEQVCEGALDEHFFHGATLDRDPVVAADAASRLPGRWRSLAMQLAWRGRRVSINVK